MRFVPVPRSTHSAQARGDVIPNLVLCLAGTRGATRAIHGLPVLIGNLRGWAAAAAYSAEHVSAPHDQAPTSDVVHDHGSGELCLHKWLGAFRKLGPIERGDAAREPGSLETIVGPNCALLKLVDISEANFTPRKMT